MDAGENRVFLFVQHRGPSLPYCAETPAQMENVVSALTSPEGDWTGGGPEYSPTYVWTPGEAGDYTLCAYLDEGPTTRPLAINFVKLTADPAPGQLSIAAVTEPKPPQRTVVTVQGTAVVSSELTASVQEHGLPCTLRNGQLAGAQLTQAQGSPVGPGPFAVSLSSEPAAPGAYEVCAYLTPTPTPTMYFSRPYEVGRADFISDMPPASAFTEQVVIPAAERPPTLSGVTINHRRFHAARGAAGGSGGAPRGTKFRFSLSSRATVTIVISRGLPGKLHRVGSIVRRAGQGSNAVAFDGFVARRKLAPGTYTAAITARNSVGRSNSVVLRFSVAG